VRDRSPPPSDPGGGPGDAGAVVITETAAGGGPAGEGTPAPARWRTGPDRAWLEPAGDGPLTAEEAGYVAASRVPVSLVSAL
jgi:hypothetical protein